MFNMNQYAIQTSYINGCCWFNCCNAHIIKEANANEFNSFIHLSKSKKNSNTMTSEASGRATDKRVALRGGALACGSGRSINILLVYVN